MTKHRERRIEREPPPIAGRVPPHDLDAEAAVLSAIMLDHDAIDTVSGLLSVEDFYSDPNRRIYTAADSIHKEGLPIDVVSVAAWLRRREWLKDVGGAGYLAQLLDGTPNVRNVGSHARVVAEYGRLRRTIAVMQRLQAEGYYPDARADIPKWISDAAEQVHTVAIEGARGHKGMTTAALAIDIAKEDGAESDVRVYTGVHALDRISGPIKGGEMVGVWARPKHGKTAFLSSMGARVAACAYRVTCNDCGWEGINPGLPTGTYAGHVHCPRCPTACACKGRVMEYGCRARGLVGKVAQGLIIFTREFPVRDYYNRMVASFAGIDADRVGPIMKKRDPICHLAVSDYASEAERQWAIETITAVQVAVEMIKSEYVKIVDDCRTIEDCIAEVRTTRAQWRREGVHIRCIGIDYLQRMKTDGGMRAHGSREREVGYIAQESKDLALETDAALILCAQLNKSAKFEKREPRAEDSRECEAAAMEVDRAYIVYNPHVDALVKKRANPDDGPMKPLPCKGIVDLSRQGKTGFAEMAFYPTTTTFTDWGIEEERLWGDEWSLDTNP